ncbi:hypothetical protein NLM24_18340 [Nocardia zapadnayensis]|nr:hypothetical protein [Nocardia zapadnayensis]MCX0272628.1 hypothetical protein [Nocardia zapadnayensis]
MSRPTRKHLAMIAPAAVAIAVAGCSSSGPDAALASAPVTTTAGSATNT